MKKERNLGVCNMPDCENPAKWECQYCARWVCDGCARPLEGIVCYECFVKGF